MNIRYLVENPEIATSMLLVGVVCFVLGMMLGDCIGYREGIRFFTQTDDES